MDFDKQYPLKDHGDTSHLLAALMQMQSSSGNHSLSPKQLAEVAARFDLPENRIYEVAAFYSLLSTTPRGHTLIQICDSPICYTAQACDIGQVFTEVLGIDVGQTTADGLFTLEHTGCIGACDLAPAALVNGVIVGNLNREKICALVCDRRERAGNNG